MTFDILTLMVVCGLIVVTSGMIFILNTVIGNNDVTGRLWSMTFILAMLASISLAAWAAMPDAWWVIPVANAGLVGSIGAVWAGARAFNGQASLIVLPIASALAVMTVTFVEMPIYGAWAGSPLAGASVALFSALSAWECGHGMLGRRINGRVLLAVMATSAVFYTARVVVYLVAGPEDDVFVRYFGSEPTTMLVAFLVLVASVTMSVLRAERAGGLSSWRGDTTPTFSMGVLAWSAFLLGAGDRIDRVVAHDGSTSLIVARIDNLPEMNLAFGRQFGDDAIAGFASLLRTELPPTSIIGYRGGGRFAVLSVVSTAEEGRLIAARVLGALVDTPIDHRGGFRLSASLGLADSFSGDQVLAHMLASAEEACARATHAGGNRMVVAEETTREP